MQDKVSYKKKLRINFSLEESRASRGRRYVLFGTIVILIAFFMVISSMGAGSVLAPSNTPVLLNQSSAIAVYNQSGNETPFANVGSTAEYTSPSNISYILTNVTAGEMSQNDVGSVLINTGAPNTSSSTGVSYSPLSAIKSAIQANNVGVESQTSINTGGTPTPILYYQANNTIYVANATGDNVWAINATTGTIITSIVVGTAGSEPRFMALDPINKHIFVTSSTQNAIYVINATTNKLNATIAGPANSNPYGVINPPATSGPSGIAYDPVTENMYVVLNFNAALDVINATQNKIVSTYFTWGSDGLAPFSVSITPTGIIYVVAYGLFISTTQYHNTVWVFQSPSNYHSVGIAGDCISSSASSSDSYGMAFVPSNNLMYVSDSESSNVYAINTTAHVNATITLPNAPLGISLVSAGNGGKGYLYVATTGNQLALINATSESYAWNGTATSPGEIVYANSTAANKVYMTDTSGQVISFAALQQHLVEFIESCSSGSTNYPAFTLHVSSPSMHPTEINATDSNPASKNFIQEYLFNASYTWAANASYQYLPLQGSFTELSSSTTIVDVIFTQADVSISESGLPSGTTWYFNITSPAASKGMHSTTTTSIDFELANGNYSYVITAVKSGSVFYAVAPSSASGNFTISSSDFIEQVQFVVATGVTFNETGLKIAGGVYSYAIAGPGCNVYSITMNNKDYDEFTVGATTHVISYVAFAVIGTGEIKFAIGTTGLNSANTLNWVNYNVSSQYGNFFTVPINPVTLTGATDYYLSLDIVSGSVSWEEESTSGMHILNFVQSYCNAFGTAYISSTCAFVYSVGSTPVVGASSSWGMNINDQNLSLSAPSLVTHLAPGTYNYTTYTYTYINSSANKSGLSSRFFLGGSGSITVGNKSLTADLAFNTVTLEQKGLPVNSTWAVEIDGQTISLASGQPSISFPMLGGTYSYYGIAPNQNYTASSGSLTVSNNSTALVTFALNTYSISFTEGLLPQGMSWTVTLGSFSNTSTQPTITFKVGNGTYNYLITANGYTATPSSGQITISGKSVNVSTVFSPTPLEPIVPAYTVTIGFGTSYQNFKPVATFTFIHPENLISIQPYYYLSVSPSEHLMFEINQSAPLHYFSFNLSGNIGAFSGIGYNGFSDIGYVIGGTGTLIALVFSMPWLSVYRENNKWRKER